MNTPNACFTRTIHAPGFGSAASPAPAIGHGTAMPMPEAERQRQRERGAGRVEVAREEHDLDDDRRDARAGEQRGDGAHAEGERRTCRGSTRRPRRLEKLEKSIVMTSNIARREHDEEHRDAEVEPGRRVDRAERAGGQDDDEAEHAVDERHRGAVRRPAGSRARASRPARRRR